MKTSGRCVGNDSRCKGKAQPFCNYLADKKVKPWYANCTWTPWSGEDKVGECLGHSNLCHYQSFPMCNYVSGIGHGDCKWFAAPPAASSLGECIGNDNACAGSSKNWCNFHISKTRNCKWYSGAELRSSPGQCDGTDPQCADNSKPMCEFLSQYHGANCVWNTTHVETTPASSQSPCLQFCGLNDLQENGGWCNSKNGNQAACMKSYLYRGGNAIPCTYDENSNKCRSGGSNHSVACPSLASLCRSSRRLRR